MSGQYWQRMALTNLHTYTHTCRLFDIHTSTLSLAFPFFLSSTFPFSFSFFLFFSFCFCVLLFFLGQPTHSATMSADGMKEQSGERRAQSAIYFAMGILTKKLNNKPKHTPKHTDRQTQHNTTQQSMQPTTAQSKKDMAKHIKQAWKKKEPKITAKQSLTPSLIH